MDINIGNVAECRQQRLGVVTHIKQLRGSIDDDGLKMYKGIGFDGKPWQSQCPEFVAVNIDDCVDNLFDRSGWGRMFDVDNDDDF